MASSTAVGGGTGEDEKDYGASKEVRLSSFPTSICDL
jgi:hypothetical protein